MSRGFVKEDDQEEPPFVPPRAVLPDGVDNYVTPEGKQALLDEKEALLSSFRATEQLEERDKRREQAVINVQLSQLEERIASAIVIQPDANTSEVRFGTTVTFKNLDKGSQQRFKIVGVDEASIRAHKVAFTAPLIKAMVGKQLGETFTAHIQGSEQHFKVLRVEVE